MHPELLRAITHGTDISRAFNQITQHTYFISASDIRFCNVYLSLPTVPIAPVHVRLRARTWLKNKTVSFRHVFSQTSATIRVEPCRTVDSDILRLLRAAFDIRVQPKFSWLLIRIRNFRPPICRRRIISFSYVACTLSIGSHITPRSPLVHINKNILRKYARVYAEGRGAEKKTGREKIKKDGVQGTFVCREQYRFACTNVTASLMTAIFFLEVSLRCMAVNQFGLDNTHIPDYTGTWAPFLRNNIKSHNNILSVLLYVIIVFLSL